MSMTFIHAINLFIYSQNVTEYLLSPVLGIEDIRRISRTVSITQPVDLYPSSSLRVFQC